MENNLTDNQWSSRRGFSTLELFVVIGVILFLVGMVSFNAVTMIRAAKQETALSQISAVFRAARQAAQTRNEERRVVLEVTYSGVAQFQQDAYELGPTLRYWVERKRIRTQGWTPENVSPPLDDTQTLPPGIMLVDVNGRTVIPEPVSRGVENPDGSRSLKTFVVFNSRGVATRLYREGDPEEYPLKTNVAFHFMIGTTDVDMSAGVPPGGIIRYLDLNSVYDEWRDSLPPVEPQFQDWEDDANRVNYRYVGRTQAQTLYLLRLTGQSQAYPYGIYPPWPNSILPESDNEAI